MNTEFWLGGIISFAISLYFFRKGEFATRLLQFTAYNAERQYIEKKILPLEKSERSRSYYFDRPQGQDDDIPHLHKAIVTPHTITMNEVRAGAKVGIVFQVTDEGLNFNCADATSATHEYGKKENLEVRNMDYGWMYVEIPILKSQSPREYFVSFEFTDGNHKNTSRLSYHIV